MINTFNVIFEITTNCNKKCEQCCNTNVKKSINNIDPDKFVKKLIDLSSSTCTKQLDIVFVLTGGEPFLYSFKKRGNKYNIEKLIELIKIYFQKSKIIIKTTGWEKNEYLDTLLQRLYIDYGVEICLGFNLFQNNKIDSASRLRNMLNIILLYQDSLTIDSIYNKNNLDSFSTLFSNEIFEYALENKIIVDRQQENANKQEICKNIKNNLSVYKKIQFNLASKSIKLWVGPAYKVFDDIGNVDDYYDTQSYPECSQIQEGINSLFYGFDLRLYPCNCPFIDFSYPYKVFNDVTIEYNYLSQKYTEIKAKMINDKLLFNSLKEQCHYCSKYIYNSTLGR